MGNDFNISMRDTIQHSVKAWPIKTNTMHPHSCVKQLSDAKASEKNTVERMPNGNSGTHG